MAATNGEGVQVKDNMQDAMRRLLELPVYVFLKVTEPKILCRAQYIQS